MFKNKKNILIMTFVKIVVTGLLIGNSAFAGMTQDEAYLMVNRLLRIDNPEFITQHKDGIIDYNSLEEFQAWERLYIKYSKYDQIEKKLNKEETRVLLYIGMISRLNYDAALSGSFSSDLVPIYNQNQILFLSVLTDLNYLIPSTCYFLNRYFGYEGKHSELKNDFIKHNKSLIAKELGEEKYTQCMSYFIDSYK